MKRFFSITFLVLGWLLFYYLLGINTVKLILTFLSQFLPENIRTNQIVLLIMTSFFSPLFAAGFTYHIATKYTLKKWSDKNLPKEDATKILKITLIIVSILLAIANLYFTLAH